MTVENEKAQEADKFLWAEFSVSFLISNFLTYLKINFHWLIQLKWSPQAGVETVVAQLQANGPMSQVGINPRSRQAFFSDLIDIEKNCFLNLASKEIPDLPENLQSQETLTIWNMATQMQKVYQFYNFSDKGFN